MGESELRVRAEKRVGAQLRGKYRLERVLGVGGMASVYRAVHRNGNRVAIKMLHLQYSLDDEMRERFVREGYVANGVDHKGVVKVIDDEVAEDGSVFVVMELLEGQTVHDRWERSGYRLPVGDVVRIGVDLLDVLTAAHARSIVHRDIKPENLFITTEGAFKVLDFGIARWKDGFSEGSLTQTGLTLGTPQFMSPEQALGKRDQVDGRSDVWAVGATLFTLLAGRYVHEGESIQEINVNAATKDAVPLRSVAAHVPEPIARVIDRSLLRSRDTRWPSALAMKRALEEAWSRVDRRPITTISLAVPTHSPSDEQTIEESSEVPSDEPTEQMPAPRLPPLVVEAATARLTPPTAASPPVAPLPHPVTEAAISSDPPTRRKTKSSGRVPIIVGGLVLALSLAVVIARPWHTEPARPESRTESAQPEVPPLAPSPVASPAIEHAPVVSVSTSASSPPASKTTTKPMKPAATKPSSPVTPHKDIFAP